MAHLVCQKHGKRSKTIVAGLIHHNSDGSLCEGGFLSIGTGQQKKTYHVGVNFGEILEDPENYVMEENDPLVQWKGN